MSEGNVEIIRAGYGAWAERDLEAWLGTLHPDVEFLTSGAFPDLAPAYRGLDGMRSFWEAMLVPWEELELEVERVVEEGDRAAVDIHFQARGRGSGVVADLRQGHALRFKDGRVTHVSAHATFKEALDAAGL